MIPGWLGCCAFGPYSTFFTSSKIFDAGTGHLALLAGHLNLDTLVS